ncbi:MAG: hypothetical protein ABI639_13530 [Thermoanaerobaculia bacterium]
MTATDPDGGPSPEDHAYFLAIEKSFLGLRQQAVLLSAADWQVAQGWHRLGVPPELVHDVMARLFERQQTRKGRAISGLRYFRAAVENAWEESQAMQAGGRAELDPPLPLSVRLTNLAAHVPVELPQRDRWLAALAALAGSAASGTPLLPDDQVEESLQDLDRDFVATLLDELSPAEKSAQAAQVEEALARLRGRLAADEIEIARARLAGQLARRHFHAPVLSLFSPEARLDPPESAA